MVVMWLRSGLAVQGTKFAPVHWVALLGLSPRLLGTLVPANVLV